LVNNGRVAHVAHRRRSTHWWNRLAHQDEQERKSSEPANANYRREARLSLICDVSLVIAAIAFALQGILSPDFGK